jgi:hypothetical protein
MGQGAAARRALVFMKAGAGVADEAMAIDQKTVRVRIDFIHRGS